LRISGESVCVGYEWILVSVEDCCFYANQGLYAGNGILIPENHSESE